ncbi:hypothetical protein MJO29_003640 [Puccinia striiformis f. sp. tritici]|nr:hypothetical protein Pst134EA_006741 [Puccinia striiformis f. sp. tritici]KAI9608938.1 hypothetical protein H4Q26_005132 [Puccinia striiformis f. sp. tritici PST-130]KNE95328.1 hypothetical protein PSTG_11407 [Puccinia striiformis f. sp. tritici PST-78]POW01720.1 hypothetical protein PSTT_12307 [Puccinia striiformis]KAH9469452.1 hypothetical protein Pst134EA_006741 [Puccinia striiformis f. sp. tritici]KAI7963213.1 hypothetical protein MJO29_003640 [Puccinia striiformis f. sp. tritici]
MATAKSSSAQEKFLKESGVRGSALNRLSYWDPTRNAVLGMMHNWLEGILQTHFQYRWGFQLSSSNLKTHKRKVNAATNRPHKRARIADSQMLLDLPSEDDSSDSDEDNNILLDAGPNGNFFSEDDIERFWSSMKDIVLPSGISRLPPNLGEEKHGRLSAAQWYSLFAYVVPLVISNLFIDEPGNLPKASNQFQLL